MGTSLEDPHPSARCDNAERDVQASLRMDNLPKLLVEVDLAPIVQFGQADGTFTGGPIGGDTYSVKNLARAAALLREAHWRGDDDKTWPSDVKRDQRMTWGKVVELGVPPRGATHLVMDLFFSKTEDKPLRAVVDLSDDELQVVWDNENS